MSKKLILFLMVLLFGSTSFLRADEVTIGSLEGATNDSYLPMNSLYNYSYTQQIYTAEEIGMAGTINSITMWMYGTATLPARTFNIYMKAVEKETFDNTTDWVTVAATDVVYSGTVTFTNPSPAVAYTFTLDTPFEYDGTSNLLIAFNNLTGSWNSGLNGMVFNNDSDYRALYARQDSGAYDPYNPTFTATSATAKRNVVMLDIAGSGPVPPTPGEFTITPETFALGYRPLNGWMEPLAVRIANGSEPKTLTASLSNTAGVDAFVMSEEIVDYVLPTGEALDFTLDINTDAPAGEYTEEFTLFMVNNERDIETVPVTATFYTAGEADIVETAKAIEGEEFNDTPAGLQANYQLYGMTEMKTDAVYSFSISDDYHFHAVGGDDFIAVYNQADVDANHLTAAVEPILLGVSGIIDDEVLLVGDYYLVVASENITNITVNFTEIPAPEAITYIAPSPADGATEVEAPVTLAWEGGANATEYQVLFGTSPVYMTVALDWTRVDDNYGTYTVDVLDSNTQYFWQINVRNSNGEVSGPKWGFTSTLIAPHAVTASEEEIFTDGSTLIKWKISGQGGFEGEVTVCDGTSTSSYIPVYGLWMDDYTRGEMIYPAEMLEEMEGGEITKLTYYISSSASGPWSGDVFNVYMMEVDNTTLSSYYTSANATIVYTGTLDGQGSTMVINLDTPYTYDGGNLLVGIEETVCGTYKSCSFYGVAATGASASGYSSSSLASVTFNQRDFLPKTTFTCGDRGGNRNLLGFNVYYDETQANTELLTEREFLLSGLDYNMEGYDINVTAVYSEGESGHSAPITTVKVSGYATFTGTVTELISGAPIAGVNVKFSGKDEFQNDVTFEGTTNAYGVYTINNVKAGNYTGKATLEGNEPAYSEAVTLAYNTTETVDFIMHELYKPVLSVYAEELDPTLAKVQWSINTEITGGGNGGGSSTGDEFFENFDNSAMPAGWTMIDADGDGYNWKLASTAMGTGYGHNASTDCILSQSYDNNYGVLYPDNYLVTPQVTVGSGSTFSFYACAQDASYAGEHFGVAVSTGSATAADFTMVQEWTMTAKGSGVMAPGRDGQTRVQGTWYEYTVDLSAYAGQQIYIAIRHFNCSDMFYLDVDDIALSNGSKGNREVETYAVYRKAILLENEITPADSVFFGCISDTLYADFDWNNVEPGLYQYGVSAHYPQPAKGETRDEVVIGDPTSTTTNSYLPVYSLYDYSISQQIYTADEIGISGTINKITLWLKNSSSYARNINVYMKEADVVTFAAGGWVSMTDADMVGSFTLNSGIASPVETEIELSTPFNYSGAGNLVICYQDVTGQWSSGAASVVMTGNGNQAIYAYRDGTVFNPENPGENGYVTTNKSVIKLDITAGGSGNDDPITPITWSNVLPKDIETTVTVIPVVPDATPEGVTVRFHNTFEAADDYVFTFEEGDEELVIEGFRKGEYELTVTLADYESNYSNTPVSIWNETEITAQLYEIFKPVDGVAVSKTGYASWTDMMPVDRYAERYMVKLNNALYAETVVNFLQFAEEDLTIGTTYTVGVAVVYSTGMSPYVTTTFTYTGCQGVSQQVEDLTATNEPGDLNVTLSWNGATPTPPTPPTPPTGETYTFESGLQGWTALDADGDGFGWELGSSLMGTGYGHNGSSDLVLSQSYDNNYGVLYPDNYLVSPAKAAYTGISFYACAQDAGYAAEHFGVAVSTTTATASAFTMVQEWTMTAKGSGVMAPGRDGQTRVQGTWYEYTVDLSAYAGQEIWVAIRHFNCSDMFYLDVDDITLGGSSKLAAGTLANTGKGFGAAASNMTRDWLHYDSGTNSDAIGLTAGGGFYWGIMFPGGTYEGNRVTKIAYYDYAAHTGSFMIYQGGTSAPQTLLYTQAYSVTGSNAYIEIELDEAVEIDAAENLWLVMHNNNGQYVAAIDETTSGVANASCISTDGSTWYNTISAASSGQLDGNWNLRIFVEEGAGPAPAGLVANKYNVFVDGELVATTANAYYTYEAPDFNEHEYMVVWVDSDYAVSCIVDGENVINYAAAPISVDENEVINKIYPNPTNGDLHIVATAMTHISIVNTMGQVVYEQDVNANEMVIDMAKFESGVYMVNIITENGSSVKRVTVTK